MRIRLINVLLKKPLFQARGESDFRATLNFWRAATWSRESETSLEEEGRRGKRTPEPSCPYYWPLYSAARFVDRPAINHTWKVLGEREKKRNLSPWGRLNLHPAKKGENPFSPFPCKGTQRICLWLKDEDDDDKDEVFLSSSSFFGQCQTTRIWSR